MRKDSSRSMVLVGKSGVLCRSLSWFYVSVIMVLRFYFKDFRRSSLPMSFHRIGGCQIACTLTSKSPKLS